MNPVVLEVKLETIMKMKEYYKGQLNERVPSGAIFTAKTSKCTITAYKSGKVLFQGSGAEVEAAIWENNQVEKHSAAPKGDLLPPNFTNLSVIGSDEVGTGDYFGPITVVAAFVKKENIPLLKKLGVKDSKNLSDEKIVQIAVQLKEIIPYSLLTLHNEKYNRLQKSGMTQGKMKALLHNQAIGHVLKKIDPVKPDGILIDQFAEKDVYFRHLIGQSKIYRENVYFSTKGEGLHVAVATASILARYAFIRHFDNLSKKAGFILPKGAGPQVDQAAARLIKEKGQEVLPSFVKLHFANTKKAMKLI